jgi:hypothetical protein
LPSLLGQQFVQPVRAPRIELFDLGLQIIQVSLQLPQQEAVMLRAGAFQGQLPLRQLGPQLGRVGRSQEVA